jgi:hypothetical protein
METTDECPTTDKWIKKMLYTCTMEYYSEMKNEIMLFACKWTELEIIMLSKVIQVQKGKGCLLSLICGRQTQKINVHTNINMTTYICMYIYIYIYIHTYI